MITSIKRKLKCKQIQTYIFVFSHISVGKQKNLKKAKVYINDMIFNWKDITYLDDWFVIKWKKTVKLIWSNTNYVPTQDFFTS